MRIILVMALFGCLLVNAWAQTTIKLKTGATVEGEVIEQNKDYVKMNTLGTEITYWSDEIESIKTLGASTGATTHTTAESTPQQQQIKINGQVIFNDYSQGPIRIAAFDSPEPKSRKAIARTTLDEPGKFTLKLPAGTKQVFLSGYNDGNNDKRRNKEEIVFWAGENLNDPLIIPEAGISNITLYPHTKKS